MLKLSHQRPYRSSYACTLVEIRYNSRSFPDGTVDKKKADLKLTVPVVLLLNDPEQIDWANDGEIVLEATGFFR